MYRPLIKCAIYTRVSTDHQADSTINQEAQGREYISRLGPEYDKTDIIVYRDEVVSGYYTSVFDRAEMKRAIQDAKENKFKLLIFKEVSRVGRDKQENPAIIGVFEQYGVRVIAINDNYDSLNKDNITFDILSVLSEQESKKISSRVSSARRQKARRGQWGGEAPIGYKVNRETKKLEIDPENCYIPKLIFDLYVNHGLGTFKVAEHLNGHGIRTKNGNLWGRVSINRVIRNQAYIGNVVYGTRRNALQREYDDTGKMSKKKVQIKIDKTEWEVAEDVHEPIIEKETFYNAQKILLSKSHGRTPRRAYHPLTGILFCAKCGQGMVCQKRTCKDKEYRYYICKTYHKYGRSVCSQANVNADVLEQDVIDIVKNELNSIPADKVEITGSKTNDIERLGKEIKKNNVKREKLKKDQIDIFNQRELFDESTYQQQMLEIKSQINHIDEEIQIIENQIKVLMEQVAESSTLDYLIEEVKNISLNDPEKLRVLLHDIIKRIELKEKHLQIEFNYDFR
ncbi:recombinase family protein [Brevibacillus laterosporus]|uniref:recombinase family protein n=1 Tax=Brevibacillus laterosporus TaxID=1465 RepID=UPI000CE41E44|nr:recombinase family protein [Brevibacillus laterosporus]MBG9772920.1 site-specific recombinase [Brevibacillus laterosporus]NKQ22608.1 recombinase family protein [Brevibacillus laterosporus]PPA82545.1 recombinase family protein [Brevibacillus laterosporus]WNX32011.1 recombinase family protein [Brevibacillus laterosporus]